MCNNKNLYLQMADYSGATNHVTLGDGHTKSPIKGVGHIYFVVPKGYTIHLHNVMYVPILNVSLFSVKQRMKFVGCKSTPKETHAASRSPPSKYMWWQIAMSLNL